MFNFIEQANVVDDAAYSGVDELFILGDDHQHVWSVSNVGVYAGELTVPSGFCW